MVPPSLIDNNPIFAFKFDAKPSGSNVPENAGCFMGPNGSGKAEN
jgi:hypothetical protein